MSDRSPPFACFVRLSMRLGQGRGDLPPTTSGPSPRNASKAARNSPMSASAQGGGVATLRGGGHLSELEAGRAEAFIGERAGDRGHPGLVHGRACARCRQTAGPGRFGAVEEQRHRRRSRWDRVGARAGRRKRDRTGERARRVTSTSDLRLCASEPGRGWLGCRRTESLPPAADHRGCRPKAPRSGRRQGGAPKTARKASLADPARHNVPTRTGRMGTRPSEGPEK